MKKIYFILTAFFAVLLSSCTNDDIPVQNATTITVNLFNVIKSFTYQMSAGDLDGVSSGEKLRVRLFVYDSNGKLYAKEETSVRNYLTNAKFELNLKADESYSTITISDVTTDESGAVPEYWSTSDENSISTLKVNYTGFDSNYGVQEILGISFDTINSGDNTTINVESAGSLVCTLAQNINAYKDVSEILIWGNRGNGFFSFDNYGICKGNPELEVFPSFLDIKLPHETYNNLYTYKFIMPQTNYKMIVTFLDSDEQIITHSSKEALTLTKGREYLFLVILDPNNNGDGKYSLSFTDVTNTTYGRSSIIESKEKVAADFQKKENSSKNSNKKSFKVTELI